MSQLSVAQKLALVGGVTMILAVFVAGWILISPLFLSRTVDEQFPHAARAEVPPGMTRPQVEQQMGDAAQIEKPISEPMPVMPSPIAASSVASSASPIAGSSASPIAASSAAPGKPAGSEPRLTAIGEFDVVDSVHKGQGKAAIFRLPDGSHLLRLEDFRVTNGPDLRVVVTGHVKPTNRQEVHLEPFADLGTLKGNVGSQNYEWPRNVDPARVKTVVIYCRAFGVVFSRAALGSPSR
ncbi:MAG: DM13 domain-containing protein [Chloroflexi bacterium]|nr:DM13 domain-containing protein [Chloroflexota bacterium]